MKHAYQYLGLAALIGLSLTGCASADGRYPSLAVRDAERVRGTLEPAGTDQPTGVAINPQAIVEPFDQAQAAHAQFTALKSEVRNLVIASRGLGPEDDRRAQALVAVGQLTSLNAQTQLALSDLDQLEAKAATGFGRTKEIRDIQNAIVELIKQQDQTLDSLNAVMNS